MKRTFIAVLLTTLTSYSVFAAPKVGDTAKYDVQLELDGKTQSLTSTNELVAYDAAQKKYHQKVTIQLANGQSRVQEAWVSEDELLSDAAIDDLLQNCAANKGVSEKVKVIAGEYNACALEYDQQDESGKVWIAKVPFGVVKQQSLVKENNMKVNVQLKESK